MFSVLRAFGLRTREQMGVAWDKARDPICDALDTSWPGEHSINTGVTHAPNPMPLQEALVRPDGLVKIKAQHLSPKSRAVLIAALEKLTFPEARDLLAALRAGENDASKQPHFLRHRPEDEPERTYVLSPTSERGSFGKFRHVLEVGAHPRYLAAKEFRGPARFAHDIGKLYQRLDEIVLSSGELEEFKFAPHYVDHLARTRVLSKRQAAAIKADPDYTQDLVESGVLTGEQGRNILLNAACTRHKLSSGERRQLRLTRFASVDDIAREYRLLERVKSPLVPVDYIAVDGRFLLITAVKDGELAQVRNLSYADVGMLSRHLLVCMGTHMARAHAAGVVHRDIKPENILFDLQAGDLLPCDFGLGATLENGRATGFVGTPGYNAPELFSGLSYGQEIDVFSLGLTVAKLALGCDLFQVSLGSQQTSMQAFVRIQERCPRRADGMYDLPKMIAALYDNQAETLVQKRLGAWYARDPELATYVFTKMLEFEPSERHTMAEVATQFAPDPKGMRRVLTPSANRQRVENTQAMMRAFAEAYQAADAELVASMGVQAPTNPA